MNEFNDRAHHAIAGTKYTIKAHDSIIGAKSQELRDKILKQIPSDPRKTKQLHMTLNLAIGEKNEISLNTRTDDGMTNGAGNVIKLIQLHQSATPSGIIWVQFDHADVGQKLDMKIGTCTEKVLNLRGLQLSQLPHNLLLDKVELFK